MIDQMTINKALLGDPEAAAKCTEEGVAIPCPVCGGDAIKGDQSFDCRQCGHRVLVPYRSHGDHNEILHAALQTWNTRPDIRDAAKELYTSKWLSFDPQNPPTTDCIVYHDGREEVMFAYYCEWDASDWEGHITHWWPLPEPPKDDEA
jgi:DNA-directed RNA polymerase subunit RPC12/RpoP